MAAAGRRPRPHSEAIDAWLWADPIRITDDRAGLRVRLTHEEAERAARQAAEARLAELERSSSELESNRR